MYLVKCTGSSEQHNKALSCERAFYKYQGLLFDHLFYQYQFLSNHFVVNINLNDVNTASVSIQAG